MRLSVKGILSAPTVPAAGGDLLGPVGQAREAACIFSMRQRYEDTYLVVCVADVADQNVVIRSRGDRAQQSDGLLQRARAGKSWCYLNH